MRIWPVDSAGAQEDYPIVSFSWLLLYTKDDDAKKLAVMTNSVNYGLGGEGANLCRRTRLHTAACLGGGESRNGALE